MVDIHISDREISKTLVNIGLTFLFFATIIAGVGAYEIWIVGPEGDDVIDDLIIVALVTLSGAMTLLCLGLLFLHWPKALQYEKKEKD